MGVNEKLPLNVSSAPVTDLHHHRHHHHHHRPLCPLSQTNFSLLVFLTRCSLHHKSRITIRTILLMYHIVLGCFDSPSFRCCCSDKQFNRQEYSLIGYFATLHADFRMPFHVRMWLSAIGVQFISTKRSSALDNTRYRQWRVLCIPPVVRFSHTNSLSHSCTHYITWAMHVGMTHRMRITWNIIIWRLVDRLRNHHQMLYWNV